METQNPTGEAGSKNIQRIIQEMRRRRTGKYDCIIGVSGGCDSSYLLHRIVELGVKPLAVHWDNGWNTDVAKDNVEAMIKGLGVDLKIVKVDRAEYDDLCRSFLLAGVPDADIPNDIALTRVMLDATREADTHYILDAHSFRTEGTTPLSWSYMDAGYIDSVHGQFGSVPLKTFPNLRLREWLDFLFTYPVERPRLLYSTDYDKEDAKRVLHGRYGWEWYGGHHCENKYTIFVGNYLQPRKFGFNLHIVELSALLRSGVITRERAQRELAEEPVVNPEIIAEVEERVGLNLGEVLEAPRKTHNDYETYQDKFRELTPVFTYLHGQGRIPTTFYMKYVLGAKK